MAQTMTRVGTSPPAPEVDAVVLTRARWAYIWKQLTMDGVVQNVSKPVADAIHHVVTAKLDSAAATAVKESIVTVSPADIAVLEGNQQEPAAPGEAEPEHQAAIIQRLWVHIQLYAKLHVQKFHGSRGRSDWAGPEMVARTEKEARPGYAKLNASEYVDGPAVLSQKLQIVAAMLRQAKGVVCYSGAGLSTAAGIADYGTKAEASIAPHKRTSSGDSTGKTEARTRIGSSTSSVSSTAPVPRPKAAALPKVRLFPYEPTFSHHVLAAMHRRNVLQHWVQQNHDRLPQKAGYPQSSLNEIHGAWGDQKNPVVKMHGSLRSDLLNWLEDWESQADVCLAVGSSLCGMNADRIAEACAERDGLVIIGLSPTRLDSVASVRIWGLCDTIFAELAELLGLGAIPNPECASAGELWQRKYPALNYHCPMRSGFKEETPEQVEKRAGWKCC